MHADIEFKPFMDKIKGYLEITVNYANPGYPVTKIDQSNRSVKKRYRAQYHRHHFQNIPKVVIRYLDFKVFRKFNYFPVKGDLSPYYIHPAIMDQQTLDYNRHFKIPFGAFVQAKNANIVIYLISLDKIQGGHEIFDLHSHRVITIWKIIEVTIPKAIIKQIE